MTTEFAKPIYTLDTETDPFEHGLIIKPFAAGLYDGDKCVTTWGQRCMASMRTILYNLPAGVVYIHNGGRFDLFAARIIEWIAYGRPMTIINSRVVRADMLNFEGKYHQIRDSFALMPFPLAAYKKDEIDINLLKKAVREKHKAKIIQYLTGDCKYLWELCTRFVDRFGDHLTIGGTSLGELKKLHTFERFDANTDGYIRSRYYYGGRVQCFQKGDIKTKFHIYDVNSMYPSVMRDYDHPIGLPTSSTQEITPDTCFITVEGRNFDALPKRLETGEITSKVEEGTFHVTRHEYDVATELGLFQPYRIVECVNFRQRANFATFVNTFYHDRQIAIRDGDKILSLFYKYVMNSCYGKFSQNPENYSDWKITAVGDSLDDGWIEDMIDLETGYVLWRRPTPHHTYNNVATAASITGAARSILLRAIANAVNPLYCDTDSIICESLSGVPFSEDQLGAWKTEASGNRIVIAGKKMYCAFGTICPKCSGSFAKPRLNDKTGKPCNDDFHETRQVKLACKGVKLTSADIVDVANGKEVIYKQAAPTYHLVGPATFLSRTVRMT